MSKLTDLKLILEKDDTLQGLEQFKKAIRDCKSLHADEISLMLRWAVTYQKKLFPQYYKLLTQLGADVNFVNLKDRKSNLMIACELKDQLIVETLANDKRINFLLEDSTNKTALLYAINNKSKTTGEKYVRILLDKCPQLLTSPTLSKRNNPLELAISLMKVQIVKALLDCGGNPNEPIDIKGTTALQEAVRLMNHSKQKSHIHQIVQYILQKGGDPLQNNEQGKNAFTMADKCADQFQQIWEKVKNKEKAAKPIFEINSTMQREKIFSNAQSIYNKYKHLLDQSTQKETQKEDKQEEEEEDGYDEDPFEPALGFIDNLTQEMQAFELQCLNDYSLANRELSVFINFLRNITEELHLKIQVYGSYATGLWISQCDIDIMLIPNPQFMTQSALTYLEAISYKLKGTVYEKNSQVKNTKIPLIRVQIGDQKDPRKTRKLDISIFSPVNNGRQHTEYVNRYLSLYPKIKPLFFVIKKLTHYYKMYDPVKQGVRSLALFLMLAIFMQQLTHEESLGELLLRFLYKYGYQCDYHYEDNSNTMMLNLPDPINLKNNIGKNTDAFALQRMFKASYIILHTRHVSNRLQYLFESKELFF